ncbi:hypothetical protein [Ornithinimicrobium sufpigmenti]|uniref:putative acetyltransferase n=1 Tax=Ornithinimicrobium sufpigmenti TaxID=2508882 RepID=UPI001EDE4056|nr:MULTISPECIES: hypothetical protein [unclassified Ornithinimicrobium]
MPTFRDDAERPDPRAVLRRIPLGRRVVVRSLIEDGERATDALGELVGRDEASVRVRTRTGVVRIELAQVVAAKPVPASPAGVWRVAPFLRRGGVAVLGEGTLRASDGSVLTATVDLVETLLRTGRPVFVLGDSDNRDDGAPDADRPQHPISVLPHLDAPGELAPEVLARAHREIEERVGRTVGRAHVHYTDVRPQAVDAARVFGWQGRVFTLPPGTDEP